MRSSSGMKRLIKNWGSDVHFVILNIVKDLLVNMHFD
jgi:hypothetical protein